MHFNSLETSIRQWRSLCNPLEVPLLANSVVTLLVFNGVKFLACCVLPDEKLYGICLY